MEHPREAAADRQAAMRQRIISHMNTDHADSLILYLRHHSGISATQAQSAELTEVTLDHMTIKSSAGRNLIRFDPPMNNFGEARERMVAMHQEALGALGLSDIKITHFAPPNRLWQWGLFFLCLWCYGTFPFPENLRPESSSFMAYGWSVGNRIPALTQLASDLGPIVLPGMLVIHAVETVYMWWSRLRKHGLVLNSSTTWLWLGNTFVSGFGCINRFDELVKEKKKAKEDKH